MYRSNLKREKISDEIIKMMFGDMTMKESRLTNSVWYKSKSRMLYQKCIDLLKPFEKEDVFMPADKKEIYSLKYLNEMIVKVVCSNLRDDFWRKGWRAIIFFTQGRTYHVKNHPATTVEIKLRMDENWNLLYPQEENEPNSSNLLPVTVEKKSPRKKKRVVVQFKRVEDAIRSPTKTTRPVKKCFWSELMFETVGDLRGVEVIKKYVSLRDVILYHMMANMSKRQNNKSIEAIECDCDRTKIELELWKIKKMNIGILWDKIEDASNDMKELQEKLRNNKNRNVKKTLEKYETELTFNINFDETEDYLDDNSGPLDILQHVVSHGLTNRALELVKKLKDDYNGQNES